jgi:hypothetical protein
MLEVLPKALAPTKGTWAVRLEVQPLIESCARYAGVGAIALREGLNGPEGAASGARGYTDA